MTHVAGADGYQGGWFVALMDVARSRAMHACVPLFSGVLNFARNAEVIAVDMPIGLLDRARPGGRAPDIEARALLGRPRSLSIFTPPVRKALGHDDYTSAKEENMGSSPARISLSRQSFGLFPRLREIDLYMSADPARQNRIREVHPELSFSQMMGGRPLLHGKKSHRGFLERLRLLELEGFGDVLNPAAFACDVPTDDVVDAYACCYTAVRILKGTAICIPEVPLVDSKGLRMEIWR